MPPCRYNLSIVDEVTAHQEQCLLAAPGVALGDITRVMSNASALMQVPSVLLELEMFENLRLALLGER